MQNEWELVLWVAGVLPGIWFSYIAAAALHELGHAAFGWISGGCVCFIRMGRTVWLFYGGGRCRVNTGGLRPAQCFVVCEDKGSFCMAAAGGCIMNALTGGSIFLCYLLGDWRNIWSELFICFSVVSLIMAVVNWCIDSPKEMGDGALYRRAMRQAKKAEVYCKEQRLGLFLLEQGLLTELLE